MFDATKDGNVCVQFDVGSNAAVGDEDCLSLNVYAPKIDKKKRAVMVYLHGGAFIMGGGASYFFGPNYLLESDVVLVTLNYRLGPFGFLATDDKAAPGNMGLRDQIMALQWVKKNIEKFGGDANKITVFGEDSGAASLTILTMSPLANGLFHSAIALSGNVLCDQYMQAKPKEAAEELASRLECSIESGAEMVSCLQRLSQQEIITAANDMFVSQNSSLLKPNDPKPFSSADVLLIPPVVRSQCGRRRSPRRTREAPPRRKLPESSVHRRANQGRRRLLLPTHPQLLQQRHVRR